MNGDKIIIYLCQFQKNRNRNKELVYLKIKSGSCCCCCCFGTIWMQSDNIKEICTCKLNKVQITGEDKVNYL